MTTIVYKDGVIAYDSRVTRGDLIVDDGCEKMQVVQGVHFFCAGSGPDAEHLIGAYFGTKSPNKRLDAGALVYDPATKELWTIGHNIDGFWRDRLSVDRPYAIGIGSPHAFTAMDMGACACKAVEMAALRDMYTGGKVRSFVFDPSLTT